MLSQTLQATHRPLHVVEELLRIGKRAIVSFPNFGFWRIRLGLLFRGRMPVSELLNHPWYETPNIHLCTIRDFVVLVEEIGARIERSVPLDRHGHPCRSIRAAASPICWPSRACSCSAARGQVRPIIRAERKHRSMIIAQLSDPHIIAPGTADLARPVGAIGRRAALLYGRVDTAAHLSRAVAELNRAGSAARYRR